MRKRFNFYLYSALHRFSSSVAKPRLYLEATAPAKVIDNKNKLAFYYFIYKFTVGF